MGVRWDLAELCIASGLSYYRKHINLRISLNLSRMLKKPVTLQLVEFWSFGSRRVSSGPYEPANTQYKIRWSVHDSSGWFGGYPGSKSCQQKRFCDNCWEPVKRFGGVVRRFQRVELSIFPKLCSVRKCHLVSYSMIANATRDPFDKVAAGDIGPQDLRLRLSLLAIQSPDLYLGFDVEHSSNVFSRTKSLSTLLIVDSEARRRNINLDSGSPMVQRGVSGVRVDRCIQWSLVIFKAFVARGIPL